MENIGSEPRIKLLLCAFACSPTWGSEIGMGWNIVNNIAKYIQIDVITCSYFKSDIESATHQNVNFHFVEMEEKGIECFWSQGDWRFYYYYRKWQKRVLNLAKELDRDRNFTHTHHLNLIGFREPGMLWKLDKIHIWGPVGGFVKYPMQYKKYMTKRGWFENYARNFITEIQSRYMPSVRNAAAKTSLAFAATANDFTALKKLEVKRLFLLPETGSYERNDNNFDVSIRKEKTLIWVGKDLPSKNLFLALHILKCLQSYDNWTLTVVGDGTDSSVYRSLANNLNLSDNIIWLGRINHQECLNRIRESKVLLFTSLREGTPHVVLESLSAGVPVVCFNVCGQAAFVDNSCGRVIEVSDRIEDVEGQFAKAIVDLCADDAAYSASSRAAVQVSNRNLWDSKAKLIMNCYRELALDHNLQ